MMVPFGFALLIGSWTSLAYKWVQINNIDLSSTTTCITAVRCVIILTKMCSAIQNLASSLPYVCTFYEFS